MKRLASTFVAVLLFSFIALETRGNAKEQWTRVRSENFTLVGNANERDIREVAVRLEQYRSILARLFNGMQIPKTVPTTVVVFRNDNDFKPFRPLFQGRATEVAGYFKAGRDLNYLAVSAEHLGESSFGTIFHEFVHLFIDTNLQRLPVSFNEGLAEYLSTLKISDGGGRVKLGSVNARRVSLLSEKTPLPLQTLLATDYDSDYYNEGDQRSLFYAQSWLLAHYLIHLPEGNGLERITKFLTLVSNGSSIDAGLKEVFGLSVTEIEESLKIYVRNQRYPTIVVDFGQRLTPVTKMRGSQITLAEARAHLGDLLLHLNRLEEAEQYLQEALSINPDLVTAQSSLGMLRVKQGRVTEAVQILRHAAARDSENSLTQYYFAYAISRDGVNDEEAVRRYTPAARNEIRAALSRAIELSPNFVEAYRLYAFVNLVCNEELDKAEMLLRRALELAPGRQDLMLHLAQLHMRVMDYNAARNALVPILKQTADSKLRERATTLLADIAYAEERASHPGYIAHKSDDLDLDPASLGGMSLEQKAHAVKPKLAKRFTGERVRGLLTNIDCKDRGVTLFVNVGKQTLRLYAAELRRVFFVTYVTGLDRTVSCGTRASQNLVVLTYRPSAKLRGKYDGEAIAIEFVPDDIEIEP